MAATVTITNTLSHIVFTDSAGTGFARVVPKINVVISRSTRNLVGGGTVEKVYLNWPAGDRPEAKDTLGLTYLDVISPPLTSNLALERLLKSYAGNPTYLITGTDTYKVNHYAIVGNEEAVINYVKEDGVIRADLTGKTLKSGVPLFSGMGGGIFTHIKLTSGSVLICPSGYGGIPYTTTTTTTT